MHITIADLLYHLTRSTQTNRFYALLLNCLQRVEDESVGTMAVGIKGDKLVLYYAPGFLKRISFKMAVLVMKHEALHLLLDHIPRFFDILSLPQSEAQRTKAKQVSNVAMDLAVNCLLRQDPEWESVKLEFTGLLPEQFDLKANESFEAYMRQLLERKDDKVDKSELLVTHDHWAPTPDDPTSGHKQGKGTRKKKKQVEAEAPPSLDEMQGLAEQLRAQTKNIVKKAVKDVGQNGARGLPHGLGQWLTEYLKEPVIPWWDILMTRIHSCRRSKPIRSIQRPNRILMGLAEEDPTIIPSIGTAYDPQYRIFKVVDVSGSMSNEMIKIGFTETRALMDVDEDIEVRVMQGDDEIVSDTLYKGSDELPMRRDASGGTDFNAYFEYIWKHYIGDENVAPDLVIIYTDGGSWRNLQPELYLPPDVPVIWLLSPDGYGDDLRNAGYGEVIVCNRQDNRRWDE